MSILMLAMFLSLGFTGKAYANINIRLLLSGSLLLLVGGFFVLSRAHSVMCWYVVGAFQGIGAGFFSTLAVPILISNWFKKRTGFALGLALSFSGIGGAAFNPVIQFVITHYGWRNGYIAMGIIGIAIFVPFVFLIYLKPSDKGLQAYGADEEDVQNAQVRGASQELPGSTLGEALRTPSYYLVLFSIVLLMIAAVFTHHVPGYVASLGYAPMIGATVMSAAMIGIICGKVGLGVLNDRFGLKTAVIVGTMTGVLAIALMLFGKVDVRILYLAAFFYGAACIGFPVIMPPLILKSIYFLKQFASIYSYVAMAQCIMGAAGVALYGVIFDKTKSFSLGLMVAGVSTALTLALLLIAINLGKKVSAGGAGSSQPQVKAEQTASV
jgi:MFS family permease